MSKEAKQAIQYAEKLKSATPTTHPPAMSSPSMDQSSISVPREPASIMSMFSGAGMTPWQDGFNEGVKMGSMDTKMGSMDTKMGSMDPNMGSMYGSEKENPEIENRPARPPMPASQASSYPREYPYKSDFYPIPEPVPVKQFPRMQIPFQSPVYSPVEAPPPSSKNKILYPPSYFPQGTKGMHETFYSPPSIEDVAKQLSNIQMELSRLRSTDERASYAMEEFVICVGMGVGLLLLLDKIA